MTNVYRISRIDGVNLVAENQTVEDAKQIARDLRNSVGDSDTTFSAYSCEVLAIRELYWIQTGVWL